MNALQSQPVDLVSCQLLLLLCQLLGGLMPFLHLDHARRLLINDLLEIAQDSGNLLKLHGLQLQQMLGGSKVVLVRCGCCCVVLHP